MSSNGFDFSQFEAYCNRFQNFVDSFDNWLVSFIWGQGLRFLAGVKPRTPVDTGDLRNHWQLDHISRVGDSLHCWFSNPMNYATFVEYGHATPYHAGAPEGSEHWVDGYFMMTVTIAELERNMPSRFDKEFEAFITTLGV